MQAQFTVPDTVRAAQGVQTGPGGYPVPIAPQTPKHLFHFIIRYEGEGIIDSNVVNFANAFKGGKSVEMLPVVVPPTVCQVPPPPVVGAALGGTLGATTGTATPTPPTKGNGPVMPPAD